jgi:hypothetical protein
MSDEGFEFARDVSALDAEQRLRFYEVLAYELTIAVRSVWSDPLLGESDKVKAMKNLNELLHRVTSKVWVERLKTHHRTEGDFGSLVEEIAGCELSAVQGLVMQAVHRAYATVTPNHALHRSR